MKLKYLVILGWMSLTFGCTGQAEVSQLPTNSPTGLAASPTGEQSDATAKTIKSGTFVAGEHDTTGSVRIFRESGKNYLELNPAFTTSNLGPDLYVILHQSDNVLASSQPPAYPLKEADYVIIERLQEYSGSQRYAIPQNIKLENYQSAVIWCRQFNATFGTAKLSS